jgi:hypothetical protein
MKDHALLLAAVLTGASSLAGATVTVSAGPYSVTYDETTPGFGFITFLGSASFQWGIQPVVQATSLGGAAVSNSFAIPDFTITANPGYVLSGPVTRRIGNLTYSMTGTGEVVSVVATGTVSVDGGPGVTPPPFVLPQVVSGPNLGYFDGTATFPSGAFNSLAVTAASITLSASGGAFASIFAQPQNVLRIEFTATPVPEPETYAMLLAGLGLMAWLYRRRQR